LIGNGTGNLEKLKSTDIWLDSLHTSKFLPLISDTTYFKLRKEGVLISLRAWAGDIEPYDTLVVIWVQIKGVPQVEQLEMF
jgi:hypothetical protein